MIGKKEYDYERRKNHVEEKNLKKTEYYWELCCSRCGKKASYGGVWSVTKPKDR